MALGVSSSTKTCLVGVCVPLKRLVSPPPALIPPKSVWSLLCCFSRCWRLLFLISRFCDGDLALPRAKTDQQAAKTAGRRRSLWRSHDDEQYVRKAAAEPRKRRFAVCRCMHARPFGRRRREDRHSACGLNRRKARARRTQWRKRKAMSTHEAILEEARRPDLASYSALK